MHWLSLLSLALLLFFSPWASPLHLPKRDKDCFKGGQPGYADEEARAAIPHICDYIINSTGTPEFHNSNPTSKDTEDLDARAACRTFIETQKDWHGHITKDPPTKAYWFVVQLSQGQSQQTLQKQDCTRVMRNITNYCAGNGHGSFGGRMYGDHGYFRYMVDINHIAKENPDPETVCNMTWKDDGSVDKGFVTMNDIIRI